MNKSNKNNSNYVMLGVAIVLAMLIGTVCAFMKDKHVPAPTKVNFEKTSDSPKLHDMGNINFSFVKIDSEIVDYLKNSKEYGQYYADDKKFVIYFDANCPYAKMMKDAMDTVRNDSELVEYYNFYPKSALEYKVYNNEYEQKNDMKFNDNCNEFCIVNPSNNQIFSIKGIGQEEANKVYEIMSELKDWN